MNDEVYVRDAKGNETAVYENSNLQYINIWGAGLEGKVRKDDSGNTIYSYYYKDHLGSITAVMDGASGTITQAQDFDAWGDICRTYSTTDTTVNKFTGKERDTETGYDYFGARYYDSRIGRWLQTEPLYEKYLQYSPYCYGLSNPFSLYDVNGKDIYINGNNAEKITSELSNVLGAKLTRDELTGKVSISENIDKEDFSSGYKKYIFDAINDNNYQILLDIKDSPVLTNGKDYTIIAGGLAGDPDNNSVTHYLNLKTLSLISNYLEESIGSLVAHEVIESYLQIFYKKNTNKDDLEIFQTAHKSTLELLKETNFNIITHLLGGITIDRAKGLKITITKINSDGNAISPEYKLFDYNKETKEVNYGE